MYKTKENLIQILLLIFCWNHFSFGNDLELERHRGNTERNNISISFTPTIVNVTSERLSEPSIGDRVRLIFSIDPVPWFRIIRWGPVGVEEPVGLQFRMGLLYALEYQENMTTNLIGLDSTDIIINRMPFYNTSMQPLNFVNNTVDDILTYLFFTGLHTSLGDMNLTVGVSDLRGWIPEVNTTLSPDAFSWLFSLNNWTFSTNKSCLALKVFIETESIPYYRQNIPEEQRDVSSLEMDDILLQDMDQSTAYNSDIGYTSWAEEINVIGGTPSPSVTSFLIDPITNERNLPVITSDVYTFNEDFDTQPNLTLEPLLDDTTKGRVPSETRYIIYYSIPATNPTSINTASFTGLDEDDGTSSYATSLTVSSWTWMISLTICCQLLVFKDCILVL